MPRCTLCGKPDARLIQTLHEKPVRETDFGISLGEYLRNIYQCGNCSVYFSRHDMINGDIYASRYNQATYQRGLLATYNRIRSLPEAESDNKQRVRRVVEFHSTSRISPRESNVLDIGSGLCVFLAGMAEHGFRCYAIDPDPQSIEHARQHARVHYAHAGVLESFDVSDVKFDIITFNKVLEHVVDPVGLLKLARSHLKDNGFVYLELPDGESALRRDRLKSREEFYIEHETIFTEVSMRWLVEQAGLRLVALQSIHEPSDKYTLYGFCSLTIR